MKEQKQTRKPIDAQHIMDALNHNVIVVDEKAHLVYANPAFRKKIENKKLKASDQKIQTALNKLQLDGKLTNEMQAKDIVLSFDANGELLFFELSLSRFPAEEPLWLLQEKKPVGIDRPDKYEYYKSILTHIPELLFVLDENGIYVGIHVPEKVIPSMPKEQLIGKSYRDTLPPKAINTVNQAFEEAKQNGYCNGVVFCYEEADRKIWFSLSASYNTASEKYRYIVFMRNITNAYLHEEAVNQRESLFSSFIEQSNDGMVMIDPEGKVILWNKHLSDLTGYSFSEVQGKFLWEVIFDTLPLGRKKVSDTADSLRQMITNLLQNKDTHLLGAPIESEIVRKDKSSRLISTKIFQINLESQTLLGFIHRDITESKQTELDLLTKEEQIRTLYNDSPIPILIIEEDTLLVGNLNKAALSSFGYTQAGEVIGKSIRELLPQPDEDDLYFNQQQIFEKIQRFTDPATKYFDCHFRTRNNTIWDAKVFVFRPPIQESNVVQLTLIDTTAQNHAMKVLFESEARYKAVAESANAGIAIVDLEERILYSNDTLAGMLGYTKDEIIGNLLSRFVPEASFKLMAEKTLRRFSGIVDQYEAEFFTRDGNTKIFSISASPLYSAEEQMIGTVGVMIDVTEQKIASEKLIETGDRLQAILASMPDMIFIHDNNGEYLDVFINQKHFAEVKYQPKPGQQLSDVFSTELANRLLGQIKESLNKRETIVAPFDLFIGEQVRHFEARISPMGTEKVISVVRDLTTLMQLENEVMSNNDLLRMLTTLAKRFITLPLNQIGSEINKAIAEIGNFTQVDRVYIFDYNWEADTMTNSYEWCNDGIEPAINELRDLPNSLFPDWVESHIKGETILIARVDDLPKDENLYQILNQQDINSLITIPLMEGEQCLGYMGFDTVRREHIFSENEQSLLHIFAELLTNLKIKQRVDGQLIKTKEILQKQNDQLLSLNNLLRKQNEEIIQKNTELDIQREKAQASDKLKTAFLNNVSHELRTPLNGIVGFAQFLADDDLSPGDKAEFVMAMNLSVSRLTNTIDDIMDMSLLMSGNMIVRYEKIDLNKLINKLLLKFKPEAKAKNLNLDYFEDPLASTIPFYSDFSLVQKIFSELIDNAIKYTHQGFVKFGYALSENSLELIVEDSGIGISDEAKNVVFSPFMQEDNSSTRKYEGSGLGLAIVSGISQILGGQISFKNIYPHGTLFSITIPSMLDTQNNNTMPEIETTGQEPAILIAEDEILNMLYIKRALKNSGFNLLYAHNGEEAVKMVHENPNIKMVLMDIKMPVMDGLEATRIIRATHNKLPIIAVTAYAANDDRFTCIEAGCSDYIAKPFTADDLKHLIRKYAQFSND